MKITSFVVLAVAIAFIQPAFSEQAYGVAFLPLDFYPKHREELGLSEDQVTKMNHITEEAREKAAKLEETMHERTRAFHEALTQNPIESEKATASFQAVLNAESEIKMLQFRTRISLRSLLTPEQFAKVQPLAMNEGKK